MLTRRTLVLGATALATILPALRNAAAQPRNPAWPRAITMGSAVPGGVYAVYGPAWGLLVQEATGIPVDYRATQGPVQNMILVERREVLLGMTTMGAALQGWNGNGAWTQGQKHANVRALFPMYGTPLQAIALKRSGIARIEDLAGRTIGLGPRSATAATYWPLMLEAVGVRPGPARYGSGNDMAGQLGDGLIEAFPYAAGAPAPAFTEVETRTEVNFLSFSPAQVRAMTEKIPELAEVVIPRGTYRTQTADIRTVGLYNFAIGHKDIPDDLAYAIVKAVMENHERMVRGHSAARETVPDNWSKNGILPFHPGAARWFREKGHAIPDRLVMR